MLAWQEVAIRRAALNGHHRTHAILGTSEHCIATHASDLAVALVALDAIVRVRGGDGERAVPLTGFYRTPGGTPGAENALRPGELITSVEVPPLPEGTRSGYLKVRDRASYEFALASAAVAAQITDGVVRDARVALGGLATVPWRSRAAEDALRGAPASAETYAAAAEAAPGVLAVITHRNAPRLARAPGGLGIGPPPPLQDDRIVHHGQHIAVVVALTLEQATAAARLVEAGYETAEPLLDADDPRAERVENAAGRDTSRGDVAAALAAAEVAVAATYTTPAQTNNPLGLFATTAYWDGDLLTVHDTTQGPAFVRRALAATFGLPETAVRVLAPYVGGAFGAGLRTWPHVVLAAVAARVTGRPVKLVLSRAQMFTSVGYRPPTVQHVRLGARRTGELVAIDHEGIEPTALENDFAESLNRATAVL